MNKMLLQIYFALALLFSSELFAEAWSSANPERFSRLDTGKAFWLYGAALIGNF